MQEENWLMKSLREAAEEAKKLPQWAKDIEAAHDRQYGRPSLEEMFRAHMLKGGHSRFGITNND